MIGRNKKPKINRLSEQMKSHADRFESIKTPLEAKT